MKIKKNKLNFVTEIHRVEAMVQLQASLGWKLLTTIIEEGELLVLKLQLEELKVEFFETEYKTLDEVRELQYKIKTTEYKISLLEELLDLPNTILNDIEEIEETNDPYATPEDIKKENLDNSNEADD